MPRTTVNVYPRLVILSDASSNDNNYYGVCIHKSPPALMLKIIMSSSGLFRQDQAGGFRIHLIIIIMLILYAKGRKFDLLIRRYHGLHNYCFLDG